MGPEIDAGGGQQEQEPQKDRNGIRQGIDILEDFQKREGQEADFNREGGAECGQEAVAEKDRAAEDCLQENELDLIIEIEPSAKHFRQPPAQPLPQRAEADKRRPGKNRRPDYKGEPDL